jgi:hypothetical protein
MTVLKEACTHTPDKSLHNEGCSQKEPGIFSSVDREERKFPDIREGIMVLCDWWRRIQNGR